MSNARRNKTTPVLSVLGLVGVCGVGWMISTSVMHSEIVYESAATSTAASSSAQHLASAQEAASSTGEKTIVYPAVEGNAAHVKMPEVVKAVYMSQCVAGAPGIRAKLVEFVETSELNAIVIDIKDSTGGVSFPSDDPTLAPYVSDECGAYDMKAFIESLHEKSIYVIGRITVFQDPLFANKHPELAVQRACGPSTSSGQVSEETCGMWKNNGGLSFVDVGAKPFWDYIAHLSEVSYRQIGFDELNFDYIRFPSDGPISEAVYTHSNGKTKTEAVEEFFAYLHEKLQPAGSRVGENAPVMSADMFGMVSSHEDDLGIGQVLESALPYFDFVAPMIYVSHYPKGFNGYSNVNDHVYDIVYSETKHAMARAKAAGYSEDKIRPWLQSFDYPVSYTPAMVESQIKAINDVGMRSYFFWDAANKYTSLREAL